MSDYSEYYLYGIKNRFLDLKTALEGPNDGTFGDNFLLSELYEQRRASGLVLKPELADRTALSFVDFALGLYKPFLGVGMSDAAKALMDEDVTHEMLLTLSSMTLAVTLGIYAKNEDLALEYVSGFGTEIFCSKIFFPYYKAKFSSKVDDSKLAMEITALLGRHSQELMEKQVPFEMQAIFQYAVGSAIRKTKDQQKRNDLLAAYQADTRIYGPYVLNFLKGFHGLVTGYVQECCQK